MTELWVTLKYNFTTEDKTLIIEGTPCMVEGWSKKRAGFVTLKARLCVGAEKIEHFYSFDINPENLKFLGDCSPFKEKEYDNSL
jgi:hypothetical protein